ncbi:MAG: c-type cytochrome [Phycisphaerales bacterium]|nr:c-type cytochrome [Phycisphaerales bacterium]
MNNQNQSCENCCNCGRWIWTILGILGLLITIYGITVIAFSPRITTIPEHHMLHAGMVIGTSLLALALAKWLLSASNRESALWAIPATLAPALSLLLMWPTLYIYMMNRPVIHMLDHIGIALLSLIAVFSAEAYVRGQGWVIAVLVIGMNVGAAGGFGSSPKSVPMDMSGMEMSHQADSQTDDTHEMAEEDGIDPALLALPMSEQGEKLASSLGCTACHSIDGTKSIGPTWKNLAGYPQKMADGSTRTADYAYIKNVILKPSSIHLEGYPTGVMPSVYGDQLKSTPQDKDHELNAIIWYINTLSDKSSASTQPPVPEVQ